MAVKTKVRAGSANINTVRVYSRLPYGLEIRVGKKRTTLLGLNSSSVIGADVMATDVDAALWEEFVRLNAKSKLLTSGSLFAARNDESAVARASASDSTGLEAADPAKAGVTTMTGD